MYPFTYRHVKYNNGTTKMSEFAGLNQTLKLSQKSRQIEYFAETKHRRRKIKDI